MDDDYDNDSVEHEKAEKSKHESGMDEAEFLKTVHELAKAGDDYWQDNREKAEDDLRFLNGEQWDSGVEETRRQDGRPCLTNNVLPVFVDTVLGDQRQNKPQIKINPVSLHQMPVVVADQAEGRISNIAGNADYSYAETMTALVRNIEYQCDAETAYDFAFQAAVESGMGFLRVRSDYLSDDTFDQDIIIEYMLNQFNVTVDPNAKNFVRNDMMWCFINDMMDKESFKRRYPNKLCEAPEGIDDQGGWFSEKTVRVSEYYERKPIDKTILLLSDGQMVSKDKVEPILDELKQQGIRVLRERKVKSYEVWWRKLTYHDVLEGPIKIPCSEIPVIPVFGKMSAIKGKITYRSIIRNSKDAQRMLNYWDSAATESVALAPKAPFIASAEQIEGYTDQWETANTKNYSVLMYKDPTGQGRPPQRAAMAQTPAAEIQLALSANEKIKSTMGIYDASLGNQGNETSGKAIIARQRQGDRGSFAFIDNLSKSIRQVGKILISMIPQIYDADRIIRLKFEDDSEDFVRINQQVFDVQTQKMITFHDLGAAKYDVVVTTGPSYATQRMEAAESMIAFAQAVPDAAKVMGDLIAKVMDWPNADEISKRLRKTLPPQMLSKDELEENQKDAPPTEPTPEQMLAKQDMDVKTQELQVRTQEAQADMVKANAQVELAKLKIAEAQQKIAQANINMTEQVQEAVAQVMAEMIASRGSA